MSLWIRAFPSLSAALLAAISAAFLAAVPVFIPASPAIAAESDGSGPSSDAPKARQKPHNQDIDFLFGALKAAPDDDSAKAIEDRIWALWLRSKSDTANLLMGRVAAAVQTKDLDLAIDLLNHIIEIKPDYVEAWNRRATIYYMQKDFGHAMADLGQVLAREPRHFGAMAGLGLILQDVGDDKDALAVYRRALAVNPHLKRIPDLVKTLTEKVEGRDI